MTSSVAEGGCLCGVVRYRVVGEPIATSLCHCRTCRLAAGAPTVAWIVLRSSELVFTAQQPACFHSSPSIVRTFCGRCGTSLTYQRETEPDTIDITTASLDHPDAFAPTREIWLAHKIVWETANESLPHYPGSSRQT